MTHHTPQSARAFGTVTGPVGAVSAPSSTTPRASGAIPPPGAALGTGAALTPAPEAKGPVAVRTPLADGVPGPFALCGARRAHGPDRAGAPGPARAKPVRQPPPM